MKKQLLILSFAFLGVSFVNATPPNSATSNDSVRNHASIVPKCNAQIVIDGKADDEVWSGIDAIPIDRSMTGEHPSLYSAVWKAFWNDTAMFFLIEVSDDNFFPWWKTGTDIPTDRIELYFDVNGIKPDGLGASDIGLHGLYQVAHKYDTVPYEGHIQQGYFDGTWSANSWEFANPAYLTTEWAVSFKALKDSNGIQFDPKVTNQIGFDVYIQDTDSGVIDEESQHRQVWSNTNASGIGENWGNMDSCGIITFLIPVDNCFDAVPEIFSQQIAVTPTLASDYINVNTSVTRLEIIDIMGRTALQVENTTGIVDISKLNKGIYYVQLFSNNDFLGNQEILKY